jgi:DNA-binding HxlR family transcriptional regulator
VTTHFSCPVEVTLSIIGGKWKPGILWQLHDGPRHFSDLERSLPGITHKVLTSQLRQLERDDIVTRVDGAYALSSFGQTHRTALDELAEWGKRNVARYGGLLALVVAAFLLTGNLSAQEQSTTDHAVVIEIGGAGEWPLQGERPNYGASLAAETTPIEHWLEVEAGATFLGASQRREIAADFIIKKPLRSLRRSSSWLASGPSCRGA